MILLLSHSKDPNIDQISSRLTDIQSFRFNIDSWSDYSWDIGPESFTLLDHTGKSCSDREINAVYLSGIQTDKFGFFDDEIIQKEITQIWLGLRDWAHEAGKLALARPSFRGSWTKIRQLHIAKELFPVPDWRIRHGLPTGGLWIGNQGTIPTKESFPESFFHQDLSDATHSIVVMWVDGRCYSYEMKRSPHHGDHFQPTSHETWARTEIFDDEKMRVVEMMNLTGLDYARLDFIRANGGKLFFLGLNPHGHFLSHDSAGCNDVLDAITGTIRKVWHLNQNREQWMIK